MENSSTEIAKIRPQIEESWLEVLQNEFEAPYFQQLKEFLVLEKRTQRVFPTGPQIFNTFNCTPFNEVKVVILGQDPYHGVGQAHGLCFSVPHGVKHPPSLVNIFKEIESDLGIPTPTSGNLECWARQGVLLLNATLTVRAGEAGSHQGKGWERFTDAVVRQLSSQLSEIIFMLWGRYAQNKGELIDLNRHHVLKTTHPSPFSAHYGFLGSKHFSQTNAILREQGQQQIDWAVA